MECSVRAGAYIAVSERRTHSRCDQPSAGALPANHPAQTKIAAGSGSAAFVCVGETCSLPVTDPGRISEVVGAMRPATPA